MTPTAPTLIIPVESQARELDAKLLLACAAAERGFRVVLGSRAYIHHAMATLPRGVYLAKSMRSLSERMFDLMTKLGHRIVAWDEEGLVRFSDADYYRRRISARALRRVSMLFAWGEDDAQLLQGHPDQPGIPVVVTGNPRIDLTRPELRGVFDAETRAIRERFGRFILVVTNFSFVNASAKSLNLMGATEGGEPGINTQGMSPTFARGVSNHKQALFDHFKALVPSLSEAFPELRIVVRPHPAEDNAPWNEVAAQLPQVSVETRGSVLPWLATAELLVHNGCTTAVESALIDTPALCYRPVTSERFDLALPNSLSLQARTPSELLALAKSVLAGDPMADLLPNRQPTLERHLAALTGRLAADRMVDALVEAGHLEVRTESEPALQRLDARVQLRFRTAWKWLNRRRRHHRNSDRFHTHRFPGVTTAELRARIAGFATTLDRFHDLQVEQRSAHIFRIQRRGPTPR